MRVYLAGITAVLLTACVTPSVEPDPEETVDAPTETTDSDITSEDSDPPDGDSDPPDSDAPGDEVDTETADGEDTQPVDPNCPGLLPLPLSGRWLTYTPACEDFTFDADGHHVAIDGSSGLIALTEKARNSTTRSGPSIPGMARGTRYLPNGDLVVADPDSGVVWRLVPGGGREPLASIADPNGIVVDSQGRFYVTSATGMVHLVDPDAGTVVELVDIGASSDGIALSPDEDVLYVNSEFGAIKRIELGPGDQVGPVEHLAQIPRGLSLLDGMTTDVCGNVYVVVMSGRVYRVKPDGQTDLVSDLPGGILSVTPALNFGSGVGGWSRTSLYVTSFTGGVFEMDVGVEGRLEPHMATP